jgi:hypothetical protein
MPALLLIVALLAVQTTSRPAPPTGAIAGHVTTGTGPVRHAYVVVDLQNGQMLTAQTDAGGGFRFDRVAPGTYQIRASKLGFVVPVAASAPFPPPLTRLVVTSNQTTTSNLRLDAGIGIEGTLVTAQGGRLGRSLAHTMVADRIVIGASGAAYDETYKISIEDGGRFRLHTLPAGEYVVHVNAGYFGAPEWYYPGVRSRGDAQVFDFVPGQNFSVGEFALPESAVPSGSLADPGAATPTTGAIEGRVLDEFGDPAPEIVVCVLERRFLAGRFRLALRSSVSGSAASPISATTDDLGRFRFVDLPPGDHYLLAISDPFSHAPQPPPNLEGMTGIAPTYFPGTDQGHEARPVRVEPGETARGVTLTLIPATTGNLSITRLDVDGRPLRNDTHYFPPDLLYQVQRNEPQAAVRASFVSAGARGGTRILLSTGALVEIPFDGPNVIRHLPIGDYMLWQGDEAVPIVIAPGENELPLRSAPAPGAAGRVTGRVAFDGAPPARSDIEVRFEIASVGRILSLGGIGTVTTALFEQGWNFWLPQISAQSSRVVRVNTPPGWALLRVTAGGRNVTDTPTYLGGPTTQDVEVVLTSRVGSVAGEVYDRDQPTSRHGVVVFPEERERWGLLTRFVHIGRVDSRGQFEIPSILPGRYLALPLPNNDDEGADPDWLDGMRGAAVPVVVSEGETARIALRVVR